MNQTHDAQLLSQAHQFDLASITAIYDQYSNSLYYYALRMLGDTCLAEDCVADVFSRLLQSLRSGGGPQSNLKAYLYRCVHNWTVDYYRHRPPIDLSLECDPPDPDDIPPAKAEQEIIQKRVRAALCFLTPEQRYVISLRFLEGWSISEIATSMEKPIGAVKSLQHRAIAALQKILVDEKVIER